MKAKRRVVTSGAATYKRRPTVRKIKPAIAPVIRLQPLARKRG